MLFTFNLQSTLHSFLSQYPRTQICILSGIQSSMGLDTTEMPYPVFTMPKGEENKSLETVQQIWDFMLKNHITRRGLMVNIGGGITTDLGGFAASTYKRGVDFLNVPTTLLAMVDASSGGKTGFNYHTLKNCIGTFAEPIETIICPTFLKTLSEREFLSGFAEMLKHALLSSPKDWQQLLAFDLDGYLASLHSAQDASREKTDKANMAICSFAPLIETSLNIKQRIVDADPHEQGLRHALNFGHTVGHALESLALEQHTTPQPPHGYCVLWGMIAELYLSVVRLGCPREPLQQLTRLLLDYYGRPICHCKDHARLLELMLQDKKNSVSPEAGDHPQEVKTNFTLLRQIGIPLINQTPSISDINESLDYLFSL